MTWWLFCICIACALLYIESCYHVCLYIFSYVCMYLFYMIVCCMITFFLYNSCLVVMFICNIDILITSIDSFAYFNIVTLLVVWLYCSPWNVYSHFCISNSYWCDWFSLLCIILFISTYCLFLLYTYFVYLVSCLACVYKLPTKTKTMKRSLTSLCLPCLCTTLCLPLPIQRLFLFSRTTNIIIWMIKENKIKFLMHRNSLYKT